MSYSEAVYGGFTICLSLIHYIRYIIIVNNIAIRRNINDSIYYILYIIYYILYILYYIIVADAFRLDFSMMNGITLVV